MIKSTMGERLDRWVRAIFPFLFRRRIDPNTLTVSGAVVSVAAAAAFASGSFVAGALLLAFSGFFDLVDGAVARAQGSSTRFGSFLDSTLDRVVDMAVYLGIAVHFAIVGEPGLVLLAGYAMATAVLTSYAKARAELVVDVIDVGLLERGERVVILILGGLTGWLVPALWLLAIGSTITVGQRFVQAWRKMEALDGAGSPPSGAPERPQAAQGLVASDRESAVESAAESADESGLGGRTGGPVADHAGGRG